MEDLSTLSSMGLTLPSPAYLFGAIVFGIIGWVAYRFGKKTERKQAKWLGIALMAYPYAISQTAMMYVIGTALCVALYFFRD
jgi:hypothetical protein